LRQKILSSVTSSHLDLNNADLEEYARLSCCVRWHRASVTDDCVMNGLVGKWRRELIERRDAHIAATRIAAEELRTEEFRNMVRANEQALHANNELLRLLITRVRETAERSAEGTEASPRFTTLQSQETHSILEVLSLPLTDIDRKQGSLYCASRSSDQGFYKVGCSSENSLIRRIEKLQSCSGIHSTFRMDFSTPTTNARRARVLLFKELQQHRREEHTCEGSRCNGKHRDWLESNLDDVKRTIGRWANWMQHAQPYDDQGRLRRPWLRYCETLEREGTPITSESLYGAYMSDLVEDEDDDDASSSVFSDSDDDSTDDDSNNDDTEHPGTAQELAAEVECSVCLSSMTSPVRTACGHVYHAECLAQWLNEHNNCPMCRAELVDGVVAELEEAEIPMQGTGNMV
jgi:hypothetical protein